MRRATGHCATHPSREATLRCRSCHKWVCDRCVQVISGHIYCGRRCWFHDQRQRALHFARVLSSVHVHPAWIVAVVSGASILLVTVVSLLVASMLELSVPEQITVTQHRPERSVRGSLRRAEESWTLAITGTPGTSCVVELPDGSSRTVDIDSSGIGELPGLEIGTSDGVLKLYPLPRRAVEVALPSASAPASAGPSPSEAPAGGKTASKPASADTTASKTPQGTRSTSTRKRTPGRSAPPVLHLVHDVNRRIAITFDGGSSSNGTVELLDFLRRQNLHVTLFLTGEFIEREPALVRQALLEGHEVGNHTFAHPHLTDYAASRRHRTLPEVTENAFKADLRRTGRAFYRATGRHMAPLWRAPYGEENEQLRSWALDLGFLHVRWSSARGASLDSRDWVNDEHSPMYQNSARMMERLIRFPRLEGGIVLMHMASDRNDPPWNHLPVFLDELDRRKIEVVKVTTLLEASPTWRSWLAKARANHKKVWEAR